MMIAATVVKFQIVILKKTLIGQHGWSLQHLVKVLRLLLKLRNFDFAYEAEYSDELDTPPGSEDEGPPKVRLPHFKVPKNDEDVKVEVGLQFQTQTQVTILYFITFTRDDCTFRIISSTSKA